MFCGAALSDDHSPLKNLLRDAFPANSVLRTRTIQAAARRAKLYVIFLTPRSGSTWLTELAMNAGGLGAPQEWFNDDWIYTDKPALGCLPPRARGIDDVNDYVDAIVNEGGGVAGLELSIYQALMLSDLLDQTFDPGWLAASFYLRRRDLAAQAISLYRSVSTGRFHSYQNDPEQLQAARSLDYDYQRIRQWLEFLEDCERQFETLFESCGISPTPLFYEDLQANPLGTLQQIAAGIGVPPPDTLPVTSLRMIRDETSTQWQIRFSQDLASDPKRLTIHPRST
jgi:LPS sulfotransferase NodH